MINLAMATLIAGPLMQIIVIDYGEYKLQELCFLLMAGIRIPAGNKISRLQKRPYLFWAQSASYSTGTLSPPHPG